MVDITKVATKASVSEDQNLDSIEKWLEEENELFLWQLNKQHEIYSKLIKQGYKDLLPIIPTYARLTKGSQLDRASLGKIPGLMTPNGEWHCFDWQKHVTGTEEIQRFLRFEFHAVCTQTRQYPAVDIDVDHKELVAAIRSVLDKCLPKTAVRGREGSERAVYSYKLKAVNVDGDPCSEEEIYYPSVRRVHFEIDGIYSGMVELLGVGRQAVLEGPHKNGAWQELNDTPPAEVGGAELDRAMRKLQELEVDGLEITTSLKGTKTVVKATVKAYLHNEKDLTRPECFRILKRWSPGSNRWEALTRLLYQEANDYGFSAAMEFGYMAREYVPVDKRGVDDAHERYFKESELARSIEGALKRKASELNLPDLSGYDFTAAPEDPLDNIPWPPGKFGIFATEAYGSMLYQYPTMALVGVIGLIAGICGRRFNVNILINNDSRGIGFELGVNVYITVVMRTGMGKDWLKKFIHYMLRELNEYGASSSFIGKGRYTGPKALNDSFDLARSQVSVFTEAGFLLKSKAGDQAGLQRKVLENYTCSGKNDYTSSEGYTKTDKEGDQDIKQLRAVAHTIINESNPDTLRDGYGKLDQVESGNIPRQSVFHLKGSKPYPNTSASFGNISELSRYILSKLVSKGSEVQAAHDPKAIDLDIPEDVYAAMIEFWHYTIDKENELQHGDINERRECAMWTRAFVKALKFAALCGIFNSVGKVSGKARGGGGDGEDGGAGRDGEVWEISMPDWLWAKEMVEYEISGSRTFFSATMEGGAQYEVGLREVNKRMAKILANGYRDGNKQEAKSLREDGIIRHHILKEACRNCQEIDRHAFFKKSIDPETKDVVSEIEPGLDILLRHMIGNDELVSLGKKGTKYGYEWKTGAFKVTQRWIDKNGRPKIK